jgi:hypothetical protein
MEDSRHIGNKIHVYLSSDSVMKINKEKILSIPLYGIAKVKVANVSVAAITLLIAACTLGIIMVVALVELNSASFKLI